MNRTVPVQETLLRAAVENLISNGLKYSPEVQFVVVVLRDEGSH